MTLKVGTREHHRATAAKSVEGEDEARWDEKLGKVASHKPLDYPESE